MPLDSEAAAWLAAAESDLLAARVLRSEARLVRTRAAFHDQQAVEKAVKGCLVLAGLSVPRIHDLRALLARLPPDERLDEDVADLLSPFAVLGRYPGFDDPPDGALLDAFDRLAQAWIDRVRGAGAQ